MRAPEIRAIGLLTGWGQGATALPEDAAAAAAGRAVLPLGRPGLDPERFRRSRRECVLGVAAAAAMLEDAGEEPAVLAGPETGLVFVTAAAYGPSNREHIEPRGGGVYFPYTAPAAVPAETAIAFGVTGPYAILIGGPTAGLEGIATAAQMLEAGECRRALVLGVEVFEECADLYGRGAAPGVPLVEAACCLWLEPGRGTLEVERGRGRRAACGVARRRLGEMLACEPLAWLALRRELGESAQLELEAGWRGEISRLRWSGSAFGRARSRAA